MSGCFNWGTVQITQKLLEPWYTIPKPHFVYRTKHNIKCLGTHKYLKKLKSKL